MSGQPDTTETLRALRRGDCAGARELRLAGLPGGLPGLPPEIFGLADTLEILDLSGCGLRTLPADLGRLRRLRVLFASGNPIGTMPPALGDCPALAQVGLRGCGLHTVPDEALPPRLRWLTLTDNRVARLPDSLGARPALQKLLLSGNHLEALPESLAGAPALELIRLAANRMASLPPWLATLPRLAWLAFAGNPGEAAGPGPAGPAVPWTELVPGPLLGEGASGRIHRALWRVPGAAARPVALKLFKGAMTSDGLPEREMAACLAAGEHPHLAGGLGRLTGHPEGAAGLLMRLLPPDWRPLAGPPSLDSCSRDVYPPALRLAPEAARGIAGAVAAAVAHLHDRGLLHGDVYAHNTLWDGTDRAVLGDLGAASALTPGPMGRALQRIEVRAWGLLLDELLDRCAPAPPQALRALAQACTQPDPAARPLMAEARAALEAAAA